MKALLCVLALVGLWAGSVSCQSLQPDFVPSLLQMGQVETTESAEASEQVSLTVSEASEESTESIQQIISNPESAGSASGSSSGSSSASNPYESAAGEGSTSAIQASVMSSIGGSSEQSEVAAVATVSQSQSPAPGPGMGSHVSSSSQSDSIASANSDAMVAPAPPPASTESHSASSSSSTQSGSSLLGSQSGPTGRGHHHKRVSRPAHHGKRLPETDVFGEAPHTDLSDDEVDIVVRNVLKASRKSRCAKTDEYCNLEFKNCKDDNCRREVSSQSSLSHREKKEIESLLHNSP